MNSKKKSQLFIEFPFIILFNNLKFVERTQHNSVVQNIHCAPQFAAPWRVASGRPPLPAYQRPCCRLQVSTDTLTAKTPDLNLNLLLSSSLKWDTQVLYASVSRPPGRGPVPGPGINYTGPREALLEFVILIFYAIFMNKCFIVEIF